MSYTKSSELIKEEITIKKLIEKVFDSIFVETLIFVIGIIIIIFPLAIGAMMIAAQLIQLESKIILGHELKIEK